jgi:hypothetical protein
VVVEESARTLLPLPGEAMEAGESVAVTPLGRPLALSVTAELNAALPAEVSVMAGFAPAATVTDDADAERVNAGASTVTDTAVEVLMEPLTATILNV